MKLIKDTRIVHVVENPNPRTHSLVILHSTSTTAHQPTLHSPQLVSSITLHCDSYQPNHVGCNLDRHRRQQTSNAWISRGKSQRNTHRHRQATKLFICVLFFRSKSRVPESAVFDQTRAQVVRPCCDRRNTDIATQSSNRKRACGEA
jgi:hypothetical protein